MAEKQTDRIHFHYLLGFHFPRRTDCKRSLLRLFRKEGFPVEEVNYIFCSDDYLLDINRTHLKHDTYTDIITFEYNEPGDPVISDIYISIDRVRENASLFHSSFQRELNRVIIHGALHLCGHKDKTDQAAQKMRKLEDDYLDKIFLLNK